MGKVVKLERPAKAESSRARNRRLAARGVGQPASIDRRRRRRRNKTALVLGGGGFTGGVYEIGALRALDLMAVNSTVNQFDVYVGTSAGSFIAALCANGVTPEEMMRVVTHKGKAPFRDVDLGDLLHLNLLEFARTGALLPLRVVSLARQVVAQRGQVDGGLCAKGAEGAGPQRRVRGAKARAVPDRHRPGHVRTDRVRRGGIR